MGLFELKSFFCPFQLEILTMFALRRICSVASRRAVTTQGFARSAAWYSSAPVTEIDEYNHVTGSERLEVLSHIAGKGLWDDNYLAGPFGTREKPVVVPATHDTRIIGCVGDEGDKGHDLMWHEITKDKPLICAECGQVFVLQKFDMEKKVEEEIIKPLKSKGMI